MGKSMSTSDHISKLRSALVKVCLFETTKNYSRRNKAVIEALHHALEAGYPGGIRIDASEPEWPVVFMALECGQLTWHIEQYADEWDGHDTDEKYARIGKYLADHV